MTLFELLLAPMTEALLLVLIHTWLGLHVLRRGVIFVDLALAQVAALGGLVALLVGIEPGSLQAVAFTLTFALLGAALLAALRPSRSSPVPQEALIGLVYAVAAALALLVMAAVPEGANHLSESLSGQLLWVSWSTVGTGALIYGAVGIIHFLARRQLIRVSDDPEGAAAAGLDVGAWDLLFYATFAVVVTHSVTTAGVLLVFVFLVAPATLAMLTARTLGGQLLVGWGFGLSACVAGLAASVHWDLPGGPAVVAAYAAVLSLVGLAIWLRRAGSRARAARRAGTVLVLMAAAGTLLTLLTPSQSPSDHGPAWPDSPEPAATTPVLDAVTAADLPGEKLDACRAATEEQLTRALEQATDPLSRIALARCLAHHDRATAEEILDRLARDPALPPFLRIGQTSGCG